MKPYTPTCPRCHTYPCQTSSDLCHRCTQKDREYRQEIEAAVKARQLAKVTRASTAYCTRCQTVHDVRRIDPVTNTGLCLHCIEMGKKKRNPWDLNAIL